MRTSFIFISIILIGFPYFSQFSVVLDTTSVKNYYEGQSISFKYIVKNDSKYQINSESFTKLEVIEIINLKTLKSYKNNPIKRSNHEVPERECQLDYEIAKQPMRGDFRKELLYNFNDSRFGDTLLSDFIKIPLEFQENKFGVRFFSAGKYSAKIVVCEHPTGKQHFFDYNFIIQPLDSSFLQQRTEYFRLLGMYYNHFESDTLPDSLFFNPLIVRGFAGFIKKYPLGPFSGEAFRKLAYDRVFRPRSIGYYRLSNSFLEEVFEILPLVNSNNSPIKIADFIIVIEKMLVYQGFPQMSIAEREKLLDEYLQRLSNHSSKLSQSLIDIMEDYGLKNLKNYAKENN